MKKALAILILLSYMSCTFGITFSIHHCKGKLKYVSLKHKGSKKKCCAGKKKMSGKCCKDKKIAFKKTADRAQSVYGFTKTFTEPVPEPAHLSYFIAPRATVFHDDYPVVYLRPPPLRTGQPPLYIAYSVFRI